MIKKSENQFEQIQSAECDCCGKGIEVNLGNLTDHLRIGGYQDGKLLDAIVCIPCVEEKLQFINIQKNNNTIGYC